MMEFIAYGGWNKCCRLSNGLIELVATAEVGPRIIHFGFVAGGNEFKEFANDLGQTGGNDHRLYGGHRLWHAPESFPRTYFPDNDPVQCEPIPNGARLIQSVEATTGIQKEIEIRMLPGEARVVLTHRLRNTNLWPVELAPWALTALAPGGIAILPLPPRGSHPNDLLPTFTLAIWPYTDLADPRWTWGRKFILLRQDEALAEPQKIGGLITDGWAAYARNGHLFVKQFTASPAAHYPDMGCSVEVFTNAEMLEMETLGPMAELEPNAVVEHIEQWSLFRDVPASHNDAEVDANVLARIVL